MRTTAQHLCSVIPPHILRHIADDIGHASLEMRATAATTLERLQKLERRKHVVQSATTVAPALRAPVAPKKTRNVYDAQHTLRLPGKLVRNEKTTAGSDVEVTEAFEGAGKTWDFYANVYNRSSVDGKGLRLDSTVHYGRRFQNAFWNGKEMVYGDGDGTLFLRFTSSLDVIAHELTHGVTQYTAGLAYTDQTGALNEHISDVFGMLVKQATLGLSATQSDWIIGEGLFGPTVKGKGIRSMAAPGTAYDDPILGRDPQPAHMRDYVVTTDDNGGVHINSGIPNHAFYLAATALGGPAWDVMGRIWYAALSYVPAHADFHAFAVITTGLAGMLFSAGGTVQRTVRAAWDAVGVSPTSTLTPGIVQRLWDQSAARREYRAKHPLVLQRAA